MPPQVPIVNLDSDDEQDLPYDVLNFISNPPLNKNFTATADPTTAEQPLTSAKQQSTTAEQPPSGRADHTMTE